ncbi:MAG: BON domain-containing protein [Candidatus Acidiferrales bacterium]
MRQSTGTLGKLVLCAAIIAGIAGAGAISANAAGRQKGPAPRGEAAYHEWLTKEVRHQLVMLPWYSVFDNLEYKIDGDRVILMGQVARPSLKDDAEAAVKKLEGVTAVENQIQILPVSQNDDRIRRAEYHVIYGEPTFERYAIQAVGPIHIIVDNGHVTLEGVVANQMDKDLAGIRANSVSGVFSVTNNLAVEK